MKNADSTVDSGGVFEPKEQPRESPEEVIKAYFKALEDRDADRVASLFAERIDWLVPGATQLPWTGARHHNDELVDYFRMLWGALAQGKSKVEVTRLLVDGPDVVAMGNFKHTVKASGATFATAVSMHFKVVSGLIVRMHLYEDTLAVAKAFEFKAPVYD